MPDDRIRTHLEINFAKDGPLTEGNLRRHCSCISVLSASGVAPGVDRYGLEVHCRSARFVGRSPNALDCSRNRDASGGALPRPFVGRRR